MLEPVRGHEAWRQDNLLPLHVIYVSIGDTIMERARIDIWLDAERFEHPEQLYYRQVADVHVHLPTDLAIVLESERVAALAKIEELEAKLAGLGVVAE